MIHPYTLTEFHNTNDLSFQESSIFLENKKNAPKKEAPLKNIDMYFVTTEYSRVFYLVFQPFYLLTSQKL